jgi:hypothetical protein
LPPPLQSPGDYVDSNPGRKGKKVAAAWAASHCTFI